MSTSLYILTNSKLTGKETKDDWNFILEKLKALHLNTTSYFLKNKFIKETGDWEYQVEQKEDETPFRVNFEGPFAFEPSLYHNIGIISTVYNYNLLYGIYRSDWFNRFRKEIVAIVRIIGGTEIIYVADNACDKLSTYLEGMAEEDKPYEEIKEIMIRELGNPITDYSRLDKNKLKYSEIHEFFLDDFKDFD